MLAIDGNGFELWLCEGGLRNWCGVPSRKGERFEG